MQLAASLASESLGYNSTRVQKNNSCWVVRNQNGTISVPAWLIDAQHSALQTSQVGCGRPRVQVTECSRLQFEVGGAPWRPGQSQQGWIQATLCLL